MEFKPITARIFQLTFEDISSEDDIFYKKVNYYPIFNKKLFSNPSKLIKTFLF